MTARVSFDGFNKVAVNMRNHPQRVNRAVLGVMAQEAPRLQREAVLAKPWTDITGAARQTMRGQYGRGDELVFRSQDAAGQMRADRNAGKQDELVLALSHGVYYGVFLELANEGNYASIIPTMSRNAPRIFDRIRAAVK